MEIIYLDASIVIGILILLRILYPKLSKIKNPESHINNTNNNITDNTNNNITDKGSDIDNNYTIFEPNEGNLSVIFSSMKFQYSIVCNSNDKFELIENRFYNEYPEYKKKICYYMVKGSVITDKTKTLNELNIDNSDTIIISMKIIIKTIR